MFKEEKNLKDIQKGTQSDMNISIKDTFLSISYSKTNKLVTALYMVTDMVHKEEPIRHKLRSLGVAIISDIHSTPKQAIGKIGEMMSFLNIASAMNLVSPMNFNILEKEFLLLEQSIKESIIIKPAWLEEFWRETPDFSIDEEKSGGGSAGRDHTRIGVQKGSTLMKVLSDKTKFLSDRADRSQKLMSNKENFNLLKKKRQEGIVSIVKKGGGKASIKDIRENIQSITGLPPQSEKTLQRELVALAQAGVLKKEGDKRWSRYSLNSPSKSS